jgi:predicted transcriptional regulator
VDGQVVSVEADDIDLTYGTGWSVLVTGMAQVVSDPAEIDRAGARLQQWAPGPHPFLVKVPSTLISGRRLMWGVLPGPGSNVPAGRPAARQEQVPRIPARAPAHVGGLTSLRSVARSMVESGVRAVLVEDPVGPTGLVTAKDIIEAVAAGGDPDVVWAGEIMRPTPRMVSCRQHPADVGEEMAACELDIVSVFDEDASVGLATALDILGAVVRASRNPQLPES